MTDNGCVVREMYYFNSNIKTRANCERKINLDKAEFDKNVLGVLKAYPRRRYYPGQIVKLILRKKLNYHNSDIPDFFRLTNYVRDSLHRLERGRKATCVRVKQTSRSKRWRATDDVTIALHKGAENKEFSTTVI